MKMVQNRFRILIAVVVVLILLAWQVVTFYRSVNKHAVGFGDFLAIRLIVVAKGIDFDWTVHQFKVHDFTIHWICRNSDGSVEVFMGVQRALLDGAGLLYKMKKKGIWWEVVSDGCWQS